MEALYIQRFNPGQLLFDSLRSPKTDHSLGQARDCLDQRIHVRFPGCLRSLCPKGGQLLRNRTELLVNTIDSPKMHTVRRLQVLDLILQGVSLDFNLISDLRESSNPGLGSGSLATQFAFSRCQSGNACIEFNFQLLRASPTLPQSVKTLYRLPQLSVQFVDRAPRRPQVCSQIRDAGLQPKHASVELLQAILQTNSLTPRIEWGVWRETEQ
ncbi:hypothetical protein G6F59_014813 [Rhizopus arrhizus]|nr:hypothetical protein G6F59_014813 [Rhizopus arrhizus]